MYTPHANRFNFNKLRTFYNISLKDIAELSKEPFESVDSFAKESSCRYSDIVAKKYNTSAMCMALDKLIIRKEKKMAEINTVNTKAEVSTDVKEPVKKKRIVNRFSTIKRNKLSKNIIKYCDINGITVKEFCEMCNIDRGTFSASYSDRYPYVSTMIIQRICLSTGWTETMLEKGTFLTKKIIENTTEENKSETSEEISNRQYIFADGKYIVEYDIIRREHIRQEIDKELFLKGIEGGATC